jgi:glycosyltransferase involved in cell wall biosynthesis/predicted SAM-dependent methyltransferase
MPDNPMNRLQFDEDFRGGFSNRPAAGKLPDPLPEKVLLNLGCGRDIREGFINIDLFGSDQRVVGMDIRKLDLPDNSADLILASDILEHFSHREVDSILKEWARVLKPGGELIIRCPNLKLQARAYLSGKWDADVASYMIFGGQTNPGDYHCIGFDEQSIRKHLVQAGFTLTGYEEHDFPQDQGFINLNMTVKAVKNAMKKQDELFEENPFEGLNFELEEEENGAEEHAEPEAKPENLNVPENFDIDLFNEVSDLDEGKAPEPVEKKINIVWEGSQMVYHSLALINREHCSNILDTKSANLTIVPYEPDKFTPDANLKYQRLIENDIRFKPEVDKETAAQPYAWIRHQWPPKVEPPKGAKWFLMQPWEFSSLRKDFVELFNQADEVWTPSNFSRKAFVESGVDFDKVQIIPNGIDPELFRPDGDKYELNTKKSFKILYVGGTIYRKGIDVLLKAFTKLFTSKDDVSLIIKDMGGDSFYKGQTAKDTIEKLTQMGDSPEIIYIDEYLSEEEMASLYRSCNLFVSPYRGEGFSLPTLEAMACGLPVIVTDGGSTDDFVDEAYGWFVPATKTSIGDKIDGNELTSPAEVFEPDFKELAHIIADIYFSPVDLISMGMLAQFVARTDWTWKRASVKMLSRLDLHFGTELAKEAEDAVYEHFDDAILCGEAESLYLAQDFDKAEEYFAEAVKSGILSDNYYVHCCMRLAVMSINRNEIELAEGYIADAENRVSGHPDTRYVKAILHASQDRLTEALEELNPLMNNWIKDKFKSSFGYRLDDVLVLVGDILREMEDLEGANEIYTRALEMNHENAYACYGAAMCFKLGGHPDKAREMFEWAVKLNPEMEEAQEEL